MKAFAERECSKLLALEQIKCVIILIQLYAEPVNDFNMLFLKSLSSFLFTKSFFNFTLPSNRLCIRQFLIKKCAFLESLEDADSFHHEMHLHCHRMAL